MGYQKKHNKIPNFLPYKGYKMVQFVEKRQEDHEKVFLVICNCFEILFHKKEGLFLRFCSLCTEPEPKMWAMRLLRRTGVSLILFIKVYEKQYKNAGALPGGSGEG